MALLLSGVALSRERKAELLGELRGADGTRLASTDACSQRLLSLPETQVG